MADEKEQRTSNNGSTALEITVSSVSSTLAGMLLEDNVRKGQIIEIPSLGIKIGKENLRQPNHSGSLGNPHHGEPDKDTSRDHGDITSRSVLHRFPPSLRKFFSHRSLAPRLKKR